AACERDVPPYVVVQGDRARVRAVNAVGLRRRGVSEESIRALRAAVRALWFSGAPRTATLAALDGHPDAYVRHLASAVKPRSRAAP
ncbi:MAG: hypothetical protein JOZ69_18265, partial [Myxococcales bacterium]|nr:hypothetical protein [Myxococcales bacterium]